MRKNIFTRTLSISFALLFACLAGAQLRATDILAKQIDVTFYQTPLSSALDEVAQQGQFEWSYNANILQPGKPVTFMAKGATVREVLHQILGGEYAFKQSGEYLILKKVKRPEKKVSGYLSDKNTGRKIPNATIYDRETLKSTVTDENGYYELPVTPKSELVVSKLAYRDTILQVNSISPRFVKIEIRADSTTPAAKNDAWESIQNDLSQVPGDVASFFKITSQKVNNLNTHNDSLHRVFQLSILPNIGTNHRLSGSVTNDVSINALVGYSNGVGAAEVSGIGSVTRKNVQGVQASGVFNYVGGNVNGVQAAGFSNHVGANMNGVQAAGFSNFSGSATGIQAAGFSNAALTGRHLTQAAGFSNVVRSGNATAQTSGFLNVMQHGQVNAQIAGFLNTADTVNGVQISGFINKGRYIKGSQIGIINFADSIKGAQIGLLNFSKKGGYIALEAATNEVHPANLSFKCGTRWFYTIFTAGTSLESTNSNRLWSYGFGIGAIAGYNKRVGLSFDLVHHHLSEENFDDKVQEWEQFAPALQLRLGHFVLAAGPTANLLISRDKTFQDKVLRNNFTEFSNITNDDRLRWWAGGMVALRWKF